MRPPANYWSCPTAEVLSSLSTSEDQGLTAEQAAQRLKENGPNSLKANSTDGSFRLFLRQFGNPITLLLIVSAILSFFLGERTDAFIILLIIGASATLGFYQEKGAAGALRQLLRMVQVNVPVLRDGKSSEVPLDATVAGDIVLLRAGHIIPGDCRLLESNDLFVNEASLTGETFPVEKQCGTVPTGSTPAGKTNVLFLGTHIISGTARAVIVHTGLQTEFGAISRRLRPMQPDTEFEKGIRRFGNLLMEVTLILVMIIFSINVYLHKPVVDSFLFALAIAVGLTPQLLPAIISINLSRGAANMARRQVIVRRLSAIENIGSMDILCSDKTGTLTQGEITLHHALDPGGVAREEVLRLAWLNASLESGFANPIDWAIRRHGQFPMTGIVKKDELPYDFQRRRLSILLKEKSELLLITKGSFESILDICTQVGSPGGPIPLTDKKKEQLNILYAGYSSDGFRVLGLACRRLDAVPARLSMADEKEMVFMGMLLFTDPPKEGVHATLGELEKLGVVLKIITGDNALIAAHISRLVGLTDPVILTGEQVRDMSSEALVRQAVHTHVFAAVEPNQKERIILALRKAGHVVGFMGDGINDAPALHSADVGISVNGAADVARQAADIVLLGNDLDVLIEGVREGRKTFANTLKYIFMATSANFGNMFSMAGASLFLPFLPLLPKQVLLTNLLTDIPEMTIAADRVDPDLVKSPRRIDTKFIRKFMIVFGIISSFFDFLTFGVLLYVLKADRTAFRTGWFIESVLSAALVVLVMRTSKAFYRDRPGRYLLLSTGLVIGGVLLLPMTPVASLLGFSRLPAPTFAWMTGIVIGYTLTAEIAKRLFYRLRVSRP